MNRKNEVVKFINSELLDYKSIISKKEKNCSIKSMLSSMPIIDNNMLNYSLDEREDYIRNDDIYFTKLRILLDNIDDILKLIGKSNGSNIKKIRSGSTKVTSLRVDEGIYEKIKEKAIKDKINIGEIINIALEDYLNKY